MASEAEPEGPVWRNWAREQVCHPVEIVRPRTREGLVSTVVAANAAGRRIKVAGSGHSFSAAPLTDGTLLRIEALDRLLDVDRSSGLVKFEAGAVLAEVSPRLDDYGLALANLGDVDRQTLAGAISTATHGTGIGFRNISAQVEVIELICADGSTVELSERSDAKAFRAARVGIGALGAIYAVTLRTVPGFTVSRTDRPRPLGETLESLDELVEGFDHFEFFVLPHTDTALCRESTRTDEPPRPADPAARYLREVVLENWMTGALVATARAFPSLGPRLARSAAGSFARVSKVDRSYRVFASERKLKFTEMEWAIPREHAREAIERVLAIASRPQTRCVFPIEVRFVRGDDALLSPSHERDSCYIAVHQDRKLDWPAYFREVEGVLAGYGGRPHWGKRHEQTAADLAPNYPRWAEFQAVRKRLDPDGRFANDYTERVLGPVG